MLIRLIVGWSGFGHGLTERSARKERPNGVRQEQRQDDEHTVFNAGRHIGHLAQVELDVGRVSALRVQNYL